MTTEPEAGRPRYRTLLELLRTADTIWDASRVFFARWDLSPSQFNVLNLLHLNPEGLSQADLSRFLIMHRSNVTGLVDRLEQRGLVARRDVVGDRRAYGPLTGAGERWCGRFLPRYYQGGAAFGGRCRTGGGGVAGVAAAGAENARGIASELRN
jgi:hypothetical protein